MNSATLVAILGLASASAAAQLRPADPFKRPPGAPPSSAPAPAPKDDASTDLPAWAFTSAREPLSDLNPDDREHVHWLEDHAARIDSIDPANEDFADLRPIADAIGDSRVVFLGEQTHGDGSTFLAKCRLVRFLHAELGFDVLLWESGLFDCREIHHALEDGAELYDAFDRGGFQLWTRSAQIRPVLDYIQQTYDTDRPLRVGGYDSQFTASDGAAAERWATAMAAFIRAADHPIAGEADRVERELHDFLKAYQGLQASSDRMNREQMIMLRDLAADLDDALPALVDAHGEREAEFMRRTVDDAISALASNIVFADQPSGMGQRRGLTNARDERMGENLVWLATEYFPDRKIIVWAATFHGMHAIREVRHPDDPFLYQVTTVAGMPSKAALGEQLYTIGFEASGGTYARIHHPVAKVPPPPRGSLPDLLRRVDHPFLFVDYRSLPADHWLREPMFAGMLGYEPWFADWTRQVDAVFFTREMMPSRTDVLNPSGMELTVQKRRSDEATERRRDGGPDVVDE